MSITRFNDCKMMKVSFCANKEQENFNYCLWSEFYIDLYSSTLVVISSCGSFFYYEEPKPDRDFLLSLSQLKKQDFIKAISLNSQAFDAKESKQQTIDSIKTYINSNCYLQKNCATYHRKPNSFKFVNDDINLLYAKVRGISVPTKDEFIAEVEDLLREMAFYIPGSYKEIEIVCISKATVIEQKIAEVFCSEIQPFLKKFLIFSERYDILMEEGHHIFNISDKKNLEV